MKVALRVPNQDALRSTRCVSPAKQHECAPWLDRGTEFLTSGDGLCVDPSSDRQGKVAETGAAVVIGSSGVREQDGLLLKKVDRRARCWLQESCGAEVELESPRWTPGAENPEKQGAALLDRSRVSAEPLRLEELREWVQDVRVLDVVWDELGERHQVWRDVCREISRREFSDWSTVFQQPLALLDMWSSEQKARDPERWLVLNCWSSASPRG